MSRAPVVAGSPGTQFAEIAREVLDARLPAYDDYFYVYCGYLREREHAAQWVQHQLDQLAFAGVDPRGKHVLDAGSGFGLTSVFYGLLGASGVCGIEIREKMVRTSHAYAPLLPAPIRELLDIQRGDVASLPYDDAFFDLLLSNEAISHYRDVQGFLSEAARVLKPGGVLMIADGNNALNPRVRRMTHEVWEAFERGPAQTVHGHVIGEEFGPFVEVRERIIAEACPGLESAVQAKIALKTAGMTAPEVVEAASHYVTTGEMPLSEYKRGDLAVDPISTQVMERLFDPAALGREIAQHGFHVKVRGYWGGASGRRTLRLANTALSALSPLTMRSARAFRIAAVRLGQEA